MQGVERKTTLYCKSGSRFYLAMNYSTWTSKLIFRTVCSRSCNKLLKTAVCRRVEIRRWVQKKVETPKWLRPKSINSPLPALCSLIELLFFQICFCGICPLHCAFGFWMANRCGLFSCFFPSSRVLQIKSMLCSRKGWRH